MDQGQGGYVRYKVTVTRTEVHFVDAPNALAARAIVSNADSEPAYRMLTEAEAEPEPETEEAHAV